MSVGDLGDVLNNGGVQEPKYDKARFAWSCTSFDVMVGARIIHFPRQTTFMSRLLRSSRDHFLTNKWNKVKQYKVTSQISITHLSLI